MTMYPSLWSELTATGSEYTVLIGTNVIQASKRDQQIARGNHFMQQVKLENTAWHTAYINTAIPETG